MGEREGLSSESLNSEFFQEETRRKRMGHPARDVQV